jgi:hypothetical protein
MILVSPQGIEDYSSIVKYEFIQVSRKAKDLSNELNKPLLTIYAAFDTLPEPNCEAAE